MIYLNAFGLELRRLLTYRLEFWANFAVTVLCQLIIAYFLWEAIFHETGRNVIGGFTFQQMVFYYLLASLLNSINRTNSMVVLISNEIYEGTLNRYLVYPMRFFQYKFAVHFGQSTIGMIQFLVGLIVFEFVIGWPPEFQLFSWSSLQGLAYTVLGVYLYFVILISVEMVSFWADNVWSLNVLLRLSTQLLGGAMVPLQLFPTWGQEFVENLPFAHIINFPVICFQRGMAWEEFSSHFTVGVIWCLVLTGLATIIWKRGLRNYSGVGM